MSRPDHEYDEFIIDNDDDSMWTVYGKMKNDPEVFWINHFNTERCAEIYIEQLERKRDMAMPSTDIGSIKNAAKNISTLITELGNARHAIEEASIKRDRLMNSAYETITLQFAGKTTTCNVDLNPNDETVIEKIRALAIDILSRRAESGITEIKRLALLLAETT